MGSIRPPAVLAALCLLAACQTSAPKDAPALFPNYGSHHRPVTTTSQAAQAWMDQGMALLYGFNHDEAIRSFEQAARLDPGCAMAHWAIGYAHGLHINNPTMGAEASEAAFRASRRASAEVDGESEVERALIEALQSRYTWPAPDDRRPLDEAYAAAMGQVFDRHENDADVAALYAEALMNLQPWDLWTAAGEPKGRTLEIVQVLEHALALDPNHPGANHFYIHAVEASPAPERALASADRLRTLVPGSGHLVHMPSHIDVRVGNYAAASDANEAAIAADQRYFQLAPPPRFYSIYYLHNVHMLAFAAMMEGRSELALAAALRLEAEVPPEFLSEYAFLADGLMATPVHVRIRFGRWQELLESEPPPEDRRVSRAFWHYGRGVALAATGRVAEARAEEEAFARAVLLVPDDWVVGNNPAARILELSAHLLDGEILFRAGERERAFERLRAGVALEDQLVYDEPPGWMQPIRHALGALLMADGRSEEAAAVYRDDLRRHPNNGWSLLGLEQALEASGDPRAAAKVRLLRQGAFARADVEPTSSCYCAPRSP